MMLLDHQLCDCRPLATRSRDNIARQFRQHLYSGSGDGGAAATINQQQANINKGTQQLNSIFSQYTPDFYNQAATNYTNYQTPQMMSDFQGTKNNLTYSLARNGILNSSAAVNSNQSLQDQLNRNTNTIANNAADQANQLKTSIAGTKQNLENTLVASGSLGQLTANADAATAGIRAPTAFQPLGNMFGDWTNSYLANMNARAFNPNVPNLWQQMSMGNFGSSAQYN
jgi:hypothetical protein